MSEWEMVLAVLGLVVITTVTRSFFFISERPWQLPAWAERGMKYAPLAALAAVVFPEVWLTQGHMPQHWQDARFVAAPLAAAWAWWRRDMLTTIAVGMLVYLGLKLGLGW
ncbi:MAG: AzlD domain-containing protein [Aquabacterium sp.]